MDIKKKSCSDRKKRVKWTPDAVKFLLELWKQVLPVMKNAKRKGPIYTKMSSQMTKHGFYFSAEEVHVKLHNLTNRYKYESRHVRCGAGFESEWSLYKLLDYLLGRQRGKDWTSLMAECADPLYEFQEESLLSEGDAREEDAILKIEYEENDIQSDSTTTETNHQPSNWSSCDLEVNNERGAIDILLNSEITVPRPKSNENSNYRILADAKSLKSTKDTPTRNGTWPTVTPKMFSIQPDTEAPHAQCLEMARWELIQLQKSKAKQEIEYRRQEFEQKTQEHRLRLQHMEEEHKLRMLSLRKGLDVTSKYFEESD